ncbi:hypothetical protein CHLRE_13g572401v5 [Chlamydomonas reinhardtii]|uniref:Uncharacterized protein n=1 Tax=Chlamydomonas reinhardtii TaxID=3055 RepID=A0A2K3CZS6_CHLRE|nr:uncharacterized protein CHLRE_13g572401v5 [Chlamydomonas reinhardtii]PNW73782.1 hypothetical protein CHLRE_13g572401v5 [Chlamydomonas reinhardtii]
MGGRGFYSGANTSAFCGLHYFGPPALGIPGPARPLRCFYKILSCEPKSTREAKTHRVYPTNNADVAWSWDQALCMCLWCLLRLLGYGKKKAG